MVKITTINTFHEIHSHSHNFQTYSKRGKGPKFSNLHTLINITKSTHLWYNFTSLIPFSLHRSANLLKHTVIFPHKLLSNLTKFQLLQQNQISKQFSSCCLHLQIHLFFFFLFFFPLFT